MIGLLMQPAAASGGRPASGNGRGSGSGHSSWRLAQKAQHPPHRWASTLKDTSAAPYESFLLPRCVMMQSHTISSVA